LPVSEVGREQEYIGRLYERVDVLREGASARLALELRQDGGTAQSRLDRDAAIAAYDALLKEQPSNPATIAASASTVSAVAASRRADWAASPRDSARAAGGCL